MSFKDIEQAQLSYGPGEFYIISSGKFVRCGVTGAPITLEELKYWSIEHQEAYASAEISFRRVLGDRS
ncbi:MAG: DUF2093 domain-containing protein [Parvularculales bacterium]